MDLPGLDRRPGKVVQAEIQRRFNSPVSFDPISSAREFFLVLSVGRCKYRLTESSVATILHSVIGGLPDAFRVRSLDDRVFRFSVHSLEVGLHIYRLRSYECLNFKFYFHLWNRGGPNFQLEYKLWLREQASEWVEVLKSNSKQTPLSGANLIPIGSDRVRRGQPGRVHRGQPAFNSNIQKPFYQARQTVFNRLQWPAVTKAFIPEFKGILGPVP